ncbi:hypothetical protein BAUCODRAFT_149621 [Baudoinia panamericana UAMH 10762]|uniref:Uncharacterized protein n=1 Tax=Baudoinia panamericana (strain UAMH 10762) TaxID=717646 RepID=M2MSI8_BAUPA|nr:uncharacterized protein BAUCODRAFT_149621 [Baudoinia panamericana UAMH 10762]EMC94473.1 hypothetical protein BAUCODRAFT_149621 [Baudoinia panamericana UAMH 10762]
MALGENRPVEVEKVEKEHEELKAEYDRLRCSKRRWRAREQKSWTEIEAITLENQAVKDNLAGNAIVATAQKVAWSEAMGELSRRNLELHGSLAAHTLTVAQFVHGLEPVADGLKEEHEVLKRLVRGADAGGED